MTKMQTIFLVVALCAAFLMMTMWLKLADAHAENLALEETIVAMNDDLHECGSTGFRLGTEKFGIRVPLGGGN